MRLIEDPHATYAIAESRSGGDTETAGELVRCACAQCGTHANAIREHRMTGSCPNCGSFDLRVIEGAEPLGIPTAAIDIA